MSVRIRQELERKIALQVVDDILATGCAISVQDGAQGIGETVLKKSRDRIEILSVMFTTDDDRLLVHRLKGTAKTDDVPSAFVDRYHAWVDFVYGNSGWDVIHDYTTNLEEVLEHSQAVAEYYS